MDWKLLTSEDELDHLITLSANKICAIFKHSTRCGLSAKAKDQLEKEWGYLPGELEIYLLDLLKYRPVSKLVEEKFNIQHQSPQLLIIKKGECIHHVSHSAIDASEVLV